MRIDVITLFPRMFDGVLHESILKIAQEKGRVEFHTFDLRDYTLDKHGKVDDRPYGGGPGMVIAPEPVFRAVEDVRARGREGSRLVMLDPQGERFDQATARRLAQEAGLILLCGHYEGFDERVRIGLRPTEISIGDYVLTGGEVPAMAVIDAVVRLLPGVVGDPESIEDESFSGGRLEYPHYTRPRMFRGMEVPAVLLNGNHAEIREWRRRESERRTRERRADLLDGTGGATGRPGAAPEE